VHFSGGRLRVAADKKQEAFLSAPRSNALGAAYV